MTGQSTQTMRKQHLRAIAAAGPAGGGGVDAALLPDYYRDCDLADLAGRSPRDLRAIAVGHLRFAAAVPVGDVRVRVFNPRAEIHGWGSEHTVIETVADDMRFLVSSITAELARQGRQVHFLNHPILRLRRDGGGDALVSLIHIEIDEDGEDASRAALEHTLAKILADVRTVNVDAQAMGLLAAETAATLSGDRAEEGRFLTWMTQGNFFFFGVRDYARGADGGLSQGRGLGLLREDHVHALGLAPGDAAQQFPEHGRTLIISKAGIETAVQRRALMDFVGVGLTDAAGRFRGERRFYGLFSPAAYRTRPIEIPLLAAKIARVVEAAGFRPASHDANALVEVLENYPRDELFQTEADALCAFATRVIRLEERPRPGVLLRKDPFGRFVSALVYLPRERFDTGLRLAAEAILTQAAGGEVMARSIRVGHGTLARVHFLVHTTPEKLAALDPEAIETALRLAVRGWSDRLREALITAEGEDKGLRLFRRWEKAASLAYREATAPEIAVADVRRLEALFEGGETAAQAAYRQIDDPDGVVRFKLYHAGTATPLSDCMPLIEHLGLKVMEEVPYSFHTDDGAVAWLQDFRLEAPGGVSLDLDRIGGLIETTFAGLWSGRFESDGFNRLVVAAGMAPEDVAILRAVAKYLRQAGIAYSQPYMEDVLVRHAGTAARIVGLFRLRHDPGAPRREEACDSLRADLAARLDAVASLDEDRILRRFLNIVEASLRTNLFQAGPRDCLAVKLDSSKVEGLPLPRPMVEIWVYGPRVEGIHLRSGKVARGGLRWSDRREDFRTEILGLMKAQVVKNAVIVPTGSKGGFYPKRPPAEGGRDAVQADAIECYKTFVSGLLSLTDDVRGADVVPPARTVRHDGDDPYLVVAADKGTASFSDIANAIAQEHGFWLDDAFASGGSSGYDHKAMAITARGAWEAVKRHFREIGTDVQAAPFTAAGVGDMSGDVFGNGMLLSRQTRLVAAFDHRHIFLDPDPDPAASFQERRRLFELPRSSWADYAPAAISKGGGVFPRTAKSIALSPEVRAALKVEAARLAPPELIQAILRAPVDLLWFGGIGTYVKATAETHAEAGDKANDAVRINAAQLRAKVVGEGANLGCTQRARIEYAREGGRINTDAIDNSAGVDCSDHEVNIKILLNRVMRDGDMTRKQRDALLRGMTDDVAALVLRDNYLQTQALSVAQAQGARGLAGALRLIRRLEAEGRLDRRVEFLPDDAAFAELEARGEGLSRPELSVLLAYAKIELQHLLAQAEQISDPAFLADLRGYFPEEIKARFPAAVEAHPLKREIVATVLANEIVNRAGPTFASDLEEATGFGAADVAMAYRAAHDLLDLGGVFAAVEGMDGLDATLQADFLTAAAELIRRSASWLLHVENVPLDLGALKAKYGADLAELVAALPALLPGTVRRRLDDERGRIVEAGVAQAQAQAALLAAVPFLHGAFDIVSAAQAQGAPLGDTAGAYFAVGEEIGFDGLRQAAYGIAPADDWERLALMALVDDFFSQQQALTRAALRAGGFPAWKETHRARLDRSRALVAELTAPGTAGTGPTLAKLTFAGRHLRGQFSV